MAVETVKANQETFLNQQKLPLVITADPSAQELSDLVDYIQKHKEPLRSKLLRYGGILFRGYALSRAEEFAEVIETLGLGKSLDYIGGDSPRNKVYGSVYTSTEAPPSVKILLHNELSFMNQYPKHIYFFCETPPEADGETIIGDARRIYKAVDVKVRKRFEEKGLRYTSCYHRNNPLANMLNRIQRGGYKSWTEVFEASTKKEVEEKCRTNDFVLKWHYRDWIEIAKTRPASITHPTTHEKVWFNQVQLWDFNPRLLGWWRFAGASIAYSLPHTRLHSVTFGDGSSIPREDIYHLLEVLDSQTIRFPWQKGDVLVLDNVLAMHGRATFKGKRRILAAMTG